MTKLNAALLRYLTSDDFRVLTAVEMGMKNHEIVPLALLTSISNIRHGNCFKTVQRLCKYRLLAFEKLPGKYDGYRLTNAGYDYLALNTLANKHSIKCLGSQLGVGKESDVYQVLGDEENDGKILCLKLHRLGRTSFRQLKAKRDYHMHRSQMSWLYLSRLSAQKEFEFMSILHKNGFKVPKPIAHNRHAVVMDLIDGFLLNNIKDIIDVKSVFDQVLNILLDLAKNGLIHCDFNEFNILVSDSGKVTFIDFPQMVSVYHENAQMYFNRDLTCIMKYFEQKYGYSPDCEIPSLSDIVVENRLDCVIKASGYRNQLETDQISDDEHNSDEEIIEELYHGHEASTVDDDSSEVSTASTSSTLKEHSDRDEACSTATTPLSRYDRIAECLSAIEAASVAQSSQSTMSCAPEVIRERVRRQLKAERAKGKRSDVRKGVQSIVKGKAKTDLSYKIHDGLSAFNECGI